MLMKYVSHTLTALLLSTGLVAAQSRIQTSTIQSDIACDHCTKCESCGQSLQKSLFKIKGVKDLTIVEDKQQFVVTYDTRKTDIETIRQQISRSGFRADDIKADPVAYEKLDGCCKKR